MGSSVISMILGLVCSLLCCAGFALIILAIVGFMLLRRRGKKDIKVTDAVAAGADSVSRAFTRSGKSRAEMYADEEDDERRGR